MDPTKYNAGGGKIDPYGTAKSTSNRFIKVGNEYVRESTLKGATSSAPNSPLPAILPSGSGVIQAPGTAPMAPNETPVTTSPADAFNQIMMQTLQKAQGVGTADILKRKRELERMQSAEIMGGRPQDQDLAGLSPEAQNAIRNSRYKTFQPLIDEQAYQIEKAQQSIDNFFKINEQAMKFGQEFADKIVAPDSVIQNARKIIELNPDMTSTVLAGFNDKTKEKILGSLDYEAISTAKKEAATTKKSSGITDDERAQASQFNSLPIVKDFNNIVGQKLSFDNIINNGSGGPADLAIIFSFMKGLDPNSVVRESEYATAAKSGNIFSGVFSKFNGYFKEKGGFLPANVRAEFQNLVNQKLAAQKAQYDNVANYYRGIAERQGLNPDNVVVDYAAPLLNTKRTVTVTDTKTGRAKTGEMTEAEIQSAQRQGFKVSFSSGGGVTNSQLGMLPSNFSDKIAEQESGGNYKAVSPVGALGKFQMMPATIKGLGYNISKEQFLNSPDIQEEAHKKLVAELAKRHRGDIDKILADYYGGPKAAKIVGTPAGNKPQNGFPSINQYVAQVKSKLNLA